MNKIYGNNYPPPNSIVPQSFWDDAWGTKHFKSPAKKNAVRKLIEKYIPNGNGNCIEIGAYPCGYLSIFGEKGYTINGIDMYDGIEDDNLRIALEKENFRVGFLKKCDFLNFESTEKYNCVVSFGFIEHFMDWKSIIIRHMALVADDGYLVITVPNFSGLIQRFFNYYFNNETYKLHVIDSMNPDKWLSCLSSSGSMWEILYKGYFGNFYFTYNEQKRNLLQKAFIFVFRCLNKIFWWLPNNRIYSPNCGLILRKIKF